jgi:hypothetical protein
MSNFLIYIKLALIVTSVMIHLSCNAQECPVRVGEYSGTVKAEWLTKTREMKLLEPFAFKGPDCKVWSVPKGAIVDGASIPQAFWSIIGGPFEGRYRDASVVHDYYCKVRTEPSDQVHEMFYHAMLENGVDSNKAKVMFYAVYWFGPKWHLLPKNVDADFQDLFAKPIQIGELKFLSLSNDQVKYIANSSHQPAPLVEFKFLNFKNRSFTSPEPNADWLSSNDQLLDLTKLLSERKSNNKTLSSLDVIDVPSFEKSSAIRLFSYLPQQPLTESDMKRISIWVERDRPEISFMKNTPPSQLPKDIQ